MATEAAPSSGYSAAALAAAACSSLALGALVGYRLGRAQTRGRSAAAPRWRRSGSDSDESTPAATPRSVSRTDSARGGGSGLCLALLVRADMPMSRQELAQQAARVVLGQFKKQHKRRDPNLRPWEEGGHRMQVLAVGSQGEMLEHQAAARGLALPTHTYATLSKEQGRGQRSVMAVGPAPAELLDQVTGKLPDLL
ncbi:hypothetical protein COHA_008516 [Chlorella ohadii]|uniref:peptidyl-tRNA hydrolase n=1 Tax=Chlorella ohadii TaxID=2649997 RepID=A0AAD5DJS7_9CHLO|nr:hypothetical protein COHA_008516 [Chlorella ohadii]